METCNAALFFYSVDEMLYSDHSNETSVGSTFEWYHLFFNILQKKMGIFLIFFFLELLGVKEFKIHLYHNDNFI